MVNYEPKNSNPSQEVQPLEIGKSYTSEVVARRGTEIVIVKHESGQKVNVVGCRRWYNPGDTINYMVTDIRPHIVWGIHKEK